jgi:CTP:molybdopterin cytidylyltransferase MocA
VSIAGLLLAAGEGRRIGGPKALLEVGGSSLVQRGVQLLSDGGCDRVLVVLGADAERVRPHVPAEVVVADDWSEGLGASLRAGLAALTAGTDDACVVALVDQPGLAAEAVRRLRETAAAHAAVATYDGRPGHPVLLMRAIWPEVAALAVGDNGARGWLRANVDRVTFVPCDRLGDPRDIDTAADLERFESG